MMHRGLWIVGGLVTMMGVVGITAFTLDDCDPGDQPPAPNRRIESEDAACGQEITCLHEDRGARWEKAETNDGAIPHAFMGKPVLAGLLAKVHADLTHPDAIRAYVVSAARNVKEPRMVEFLTECGLPTDSHYGIEGIRLFLPCLTDAAKALADFRDAQAQKDDDARELRAAQRRRAIDGYRNPDRQMAIMRFLEKGVSTFFTSADAIHIVLLQKAEELAPEYLMELQLECGFHEQSIVPSVGPRTIACLEHLAQRIARMRNASPVIARLMLQVPPSLHSDVAIKAYLLHHLLHPGECENEKQHRQRVREVQEACGLPAVTGTVGPRTENCIRGIAASMALERGFYLTGPAAVCERAGGPVADGDILYELGWYGPDGKPVSDPPQPGIVRDDD